MDEPSVLDYLKARLAPWRGPAPAIPAEKDPAADPADRSVQPGSIAGDGTRTPSSLENEMATRTGQRRLPWRAPTAVLLALLAQRALEPPDRGVPTALFFYGLAGGLILWAALRGEWQLARSNSVIEDLEIFISARRLSLVVFSLPFAVLAYWGFGNYLFTTLNLVLWGITLIGVLVGFSSGSMEDIRRWLTRLRAAATRPGWNLWISRGTLALLAVSAVVFFFRTYRLADVPSQMISDHAEKLLDIMDVLDGQYAVFFPRNTGREAIQMYLTAGIISLLHTGVSFLSLKLGTVFAGLVTLPFVYLLGKEVGSKNTGLFAMLFAGIAYWPNVTSRIALRFTLYALFVAPTLFFLIRGLRTGRRNDFVLAGIALGLGLHGYSSFRVVPFVVLAGVGLFWLHNRTGILQRRAFWGLVIVAVVSFAVFLPLFRYAVDNPDMFSYRALTRVSSIERPLEGPAWQIFLKNSWNASIMFFWSDGNTWVHSVSRRPALDVVSAALYFLGVVSMLWRYMQKRSWVDLFLLVSIPLLLMPSIISLAFPEENPSLNRTTGAWVPVFVIVGLSLDGLLGNIRRQLSGKAGWIAIASLAALLVTWSAAQNYDLVFRQYARQYDLSSWNTTEVGGVVRDFAVSVGSPETVWVVGYPHWVDTRLVGINAGYPRRDYAIWPDQLDATLEIAGPKLFILKPEDETGLAVLREMYPAGQLRNYNARVDGKDFYLYLVPP